LNGHKEMPKLVAALRARDQQLGRIGKDAERVASSAEPPLNFNSERATPWRMTARFISVKRIIADRRVFSYA
jgi:hypothetical protein